MERAEIYLPPDSDPWQWYHSSYAVAEANGWPVLGVAHIWEDFRAALARPCTRCGWGVGAEIGIIPMRSMLPADRRPRLVVVAEQPRPARLMPPRQRRPGRLR
jgi:hypothetical protein